MEIRQYLDSGIVEDFCLGLLDEQDTAYVMQMAAIYPDIFTEISAVEDVLENLARANAVEPAPHNRKKILAELGFDDDWLDIDNLPAVDRYSNSDQWYEVLSHLLPSGPLPDMWMHEVRKDSHYQQMLVVTNMDVPEEEHDDLLESFFILKGHCECTVDNVLYRLNEGDFLEIPLHKHHDIKITSPHVVAILQYQFV